MPDEEVNLNNVFQRIKDRALEHGVYAETSIPDIVTFCYNNRYLNFLDKGRKLFPMQEIILKSFYRGQQGNENIKLTKDEQEQLRDTGQHDALEKYLSGELMRELILVLGRRSGKDFMCGIMAAYEAMRLLEVPGGSPYRYYGIAEGNPIYIVTVANSSDQAKVLFNEIKNHCILSDYFRDKIGDIESDKIWLLTPDDRKHNKKMEDAGIGNSGRTKGSVCIMSGHSNSDSLLGKGYYALLFDEVASFKETAGSSSGSRLYSALGPGTVAFQRPILDKSGQPIRDENGKVKMRLDSKIISISSPRGEKGVFFKMYQDTPKVKTRIAYQLPTWKVNKSITYELLRSENRYMNQNDFDMEFGAQFSGMGGEKFIPNDYVDFAISIGRETGLDQRQFGVPGITYYAHLDPAATSHNYALVVLHVEDRIRWVEKEDGSRKKEKVKFFVVDHMKAWEPVGKKAISVEEVDNYIIDLAKRFRFGMVSYDAWNSLSSIQRLRSKGIPTKVTPFRKQYKMFIYSHLEHLLVSKTLALPHKGLHAQDMEMELKCLKRSYGTSSGFKIEPDPEADKTTDDLADALAGAAGVAIENHFAGYPKGTTVYMPQGGQGGFMNQGWKVGNGFYSHPQWEKAHQKFSGKI